MDQKEIPGQTARVGSLLVVVATRSDRLLSGTAAEQQWVDTIAVMIDRVLPAVSQQDQRNPMNPKIDPLFTVLKVNSRLFINCLDGASDDIARRRISMSTNNMAFIALHLADARFCLANYLGLKLENPFKSLENVRSIGEVTDWPTVEKLRREWQSVTVALLELFPKLTEEVLNEKSSESLPVDDPTKLGGLTFLLQHESYHIGQLALLRKHFGLGAMKY